MTKEVKSPAESTQEKREKKTYNGEPIPEGYVLAPVWLQRDFAKYYPGLKMENLTTRSFAGMEYMAMAGWKTEDMLSGIEGVMNLAAASGEDLATTSDIVTDALTAFG